MKKTLLILLSLFGCFALGARTLNYDRIAPHPRLLLPAGGEERIRQAVGKSSGLQRVEQRIFAFSDSTLTTPPVERIKEGKRLLAVSREALKRIYYLSYTYRMTGDVRYADRAAVEMEAVCRFTDWNPTHFLDVGEMVMALAIGYDWLYDRLSPELRRTVREAILEKGFKAAEDRKNAWFYRATNNWNAVCNSGLTLGALAIFEDEPEAAEAIIEKCLETNPKTMVCYGPDGGYPEGFGYWGYGTSFEVLLIASLESALGSDNGLTQIPGFLPSARFMQYMTAPSGDCFCFSDSPCKAEANMMIFWFARKLNDLSVLWLEKGYLNQPDTHFAEDRLLPSLLVFASQVDLDAVRPPKRKTWVNRGQTPLYIYRGGWKSPSDTYLGVKGGTASTSHAHMDAGSFVYEKSGVRWSMDLGMQSYITLESRGVDLWNMSQEGQRWEVYRLCNQAHSTLTVNGHRHNVKGVAPIVRTFDRPAKRGAEVDLTEIFAGDLQKAVRTLTLDRKDDLTVRDWLETGDAAAEVMWVMTTPADARIVGPNAIELTANGRTMRLTVECETPVDMRIWTTEPPHDYDHKNPGTRRVGFVTELPASTAATIAVRLNEQTTRN